ncbi:hypothetical protein MmiHf6_04760 [Methanimicrococcus hongohii]|uniref:Uncharacterized protein n=1 Tax=Methanimicrococcus hongohii TaxID=3028295 RepID=A0AA96UYV1_9EURY|nr:hypothetical protein [Methanimicrococcus sp. Hf6]WNY23172.1 hypothetical protein MmiHf6_04760 [Methanimicrococcus sp. Hf6]
MEQQFSENEDNKESEEPDSSNQMKSEIIRMGLFSFELEEKREQSLITQSGYMLTGFSIIFVMLLAAVPILLDYTKLPSSVVFLFIGISLMFLIISMLFTVAAQWRYQHYGLKDIESIYNFMYFESLETADDWWLKNLNELYNFKNDSNNTRSRLMKLSAVSFSFSILTILIYLITLLIILHRGS